MNVPDSINEFVNALAQRALPFATAMAAIGVLSMAIIQTAKDIFPLLRFFQRRYLRAWLTARTAEAKKRRAEAPTDAAKAEEDLIHLATSGDADAFYDLSVEQLCGQMNSAAQIVIEYPDRHRALLEALASQADPVDIQTVLAPPDYANLERDKLEPEQIRTVNALVDARNRLTHQIQRSIDSLQISMGFRWKLYLQLASFATSFAVAFIGLEAFTPGVKGTDFFVAILTGLAAGFLAPIARDLVVALQQLRKD